MAVPTQYREGPSTKRLTMRAMVADDADAFFRLTSNDDVMRYTHEPLFTSVDQARNAIVNYPDFESFGYGRWACVLRETNAVIGFCGLKVLTDLDKTDLGYRFLPDYWGRGLATEAGKACLRFGFETLKLPEIIALTIPENHASIRVLQKVGMHFDRAFAYDGIDVWQYKAANPASGPAQD